MSSSELCLVSIRVIVLSIDCHTIWLLEDVVHGLGHCWLLVHDLFLLSPSAAHTTVDGICLLVWNLNAELLSHLSMPSPAVSRYDATNLFYRHNHLNGIQAVQSKVIREVRRCGELA